MKVNKLAFAAVAACGVWAVSLLARLVFDGLCPVGRCSCSYDDAHFSLIDNVLWSMATPLLVGLVARMGGIKTAMRAIPVAAGFEFATLCLIINEGFHCFIAKPAYFFGCIALYVVGAAISVFAAFCCIGRLVVAELRLQNSGRWRLSRSRLLLSLLLFCL